MILSTPLPPREGIGFYVWNLSQYLLQAGHQVQMITRRRKGEAGYERIGGIPVWRPTFLPAYPFHVQLHARFVDRVTQRLRGQVDLYHLHTPLVLPTQERVPQLVTVHSAMKTDTRAEPAKNMLSLLIKLQAPFSFQVEQRLFHRADGLAAVARSVAHELQAYGIDPGQVAVLGNGADTRLFQPATQNMRRSSAPFALTVARLAPRKGLRDLIECAELVTRQLPHFRFLIAGSGPLEAELRAEIARRNLIDRVILLGHVTDRADLVRLYQEAAVFIHPARYEGLPTVLLEAMACGCPAVATAISGVLDVIEPGKNGLLVPPAKPTLMAEAVLCLLRDPGLRISLSRAALTTVRESFSWEEISRKYLDRYAALSSGSAL